MRVCLMIEGQEGVTWKQWVALARACEEHGLDALFRSDHYTSFGHPSEWGSLDAWATLAALGAVTERIRLGTLVSPVTFRHPSELAKAVVTADHASGGRVELGMGTGWFEAEHRAYGFPFPPVPERLQMLTEQVEVVHRSWERSEGPLDFEGSHYRLKGCFALPKPLQEPHPPLILGGSAGPKVSALAARWADEYNVNFVTPEECAAAGERLTRACETAGRDPASLRRSLMTGLVVGRDRDELGRRAAALMARRGGAGDPFAFLDGLGEEWVRGTTQEVLDRIGEYAAAGIERIMLQHLVHEDLETVAEIGADLVPALANA